MLENSKNNYKASFRGISIFGGVQFVSILSSLVRTKIIAVVLGAQGFGILSIYNSIILIFSTLSSLGFNTVITRDVAVDIYGTDKKSKNKTISIVLIIILFSSTLGLVLTILLSPFISYISFKDYSYTFKFVILSIAIFFTNYSNGLNALLQGSQQVKILAKSNILTAVLSVLISLPIIVFLKDNGILIFVIVYPSISFILNYFFIKKKSFLFQNAILLLDRSSIKEAQTYFRKSIKFGISIILSTLMVYLVGFWIKIYISNLSGIEYVGYFDASWVINSSYLGIIFNVIAMDFFPRLSSNSSNEKNLNEILNQQGEISLLVITPLIFLMLCFLPLIIRVLYSKNFLIIDNTLLLFLLGSFIKVGGWLLAYVIIVKKNTSLYIILESFFNLISIILYTIGYKYFNLVGIGVSYLLLYVIHLIINVWIVKKYYNIVFSKTFWFIFLYNLLFLILATLIFYIENFIVKSILFSITSVLLLIYCYNELNDRVELNKYVKKNLGKYYS